MTTASLIDQLERGVRIFDLARTMEVGMPQSPNHPEFRLAMPRRHGDSVRADGGSAANDLLVTGTHVGTHVDALGHVSHCGELYRGVDAQAAQLGGRLSSHGVDEIEPMICRGLLFDVPATLGVDCCDAGYEITTDDLEATVERTGVEVRSGDVVLIRSGWGANWDDAERFVGRDSGVPGVGESGAKWLSDCSPRAVGADTIAFECLKPGAGHALLPAHRVLLVESGINIIETMALDELAAAGVHEFVFVMTPLPLRGATGSPVRPLAIVAV